MCVESGSRKFPGCGIGVIEGVAEDHLEVDVGRAMDQRVDVPSGGLDAGSVGERATPRSCVMVSTRRLDSSGYGVGMTTSGSSAKFAVNRWRLASSWDRSMASCIMLGELVDQQRRSELGELGVLLLQVGGDGLHQIEIVQHAVVRRRRGEPSPPRWCRPSGWPCAPVRPTPRRTARPRTSRRASPRARRARARPAAARAPVDRRARRPGASSSSSATSRRRRRGGG